MRQEVAGLAVHQRLAHAPGVHASYRRLTRLGLQERERERLDVVGDEDRDVCGRIHCGHVDQRARDDQPGGDGACGRQGAGLLDERAASDHEAPRLRAGSVQAFDEGDEAVVALLAPVPRGQQHDGRVHGDPERIAKGDRRLLVS